VPAPAKDVLAAGVVVFRPGRRVLLVHRPKYDDWSFPKGKQDPGEHVTVTAVREVLEETGLKVTGTRYLFTIPNIYNYSGMELHTMDMFFECSVGDTGTLLANDDVAALRWVAIEELDSKDFGLQTISRSIEMFKKMKENKNIQE
jgi:8-oxo-dGTP diphosphatase